MFYNIAIDTRKRRSIAIGRSNTGRPVLGAVEFHEIGIMPALIITYQKGELDIIRYVAQYLSKRKLEPKIYFRLIGMRLSVRIVFTIETLDRTMMEGLFNASVLRQIETGVDEVPTRLFLTDLWSFDRNEVDPFFREHAKRRMFIVALGALGQDHNIEVYAKFTLSHWYTGLWSYEQLVHEICNT